MLVAGVLGVAGIVNGIAMYAFSIKSADPGISTGIFMLVLLMCMLVSTLVFDWLFNGAVLSKQQAVGAILAIGAIYMLSNGK